MAAARIRLERIQMLFSGGMARLILGIQPDGTKLVIRELLPKNVFKWRIHRGFVKGTGIREQLTYHPNIVFSVERGYSGLMPYEVIEYVPGSNLRKLIQNKNPVIKERSFEILRQASTAIGYMHGRGFIHLDIKAENLLVVADGDDLTIKLTDFDLSEELRGERRARYRSGTQSHMAPEQLKHGQLGPGADIFAFGVMAYNLVTGRMPFHGATEKELLWQHLSESHTVTAPRKLNPDLMPRLEWVILRCLEKDPAKRFPSMSYLRQELSKM